MVESEVQWTSLDLEVEGKYWSCVRRSPTSIREAHSTETSERIARPKEWWTWSGSNRRPLPCHGSALPAAPQAHAQKRAERPLRCVRINFTRLQRGVKLQRDDSPSCE